MQNPIAFIKSVHKQANIELPFTTELIQEIEALNTKPSLSADEMVRYTEANFVLSYMAMELSNMMKKSGILQ